MRALLALALLTGLAAGQDAFRDADFDFSLRVPGGMVALDEAEARAFFGLPADVPYNASRDEYSGLDIAQTMPFIHSWFWKDATGRSREMKLQLHDLTLPFTKPDDFTTAIEQEAGRGARITIIEETQLAPPTYRGGLMVEVERIDSSGLATRMLFCYFPMGNERFALLYMQGLLADWSELRGEFLETVASVRFTGGGSGGGAGPGAGAGGGGGGKAGRRGGAPGQGGRTGGPADAAAEDGFAVEDWSSLEVTGSLVLALVLLLGAFLGGRKGP